MIVEWQLLDLKKIYIYLWGKIPGLKQTAFSPVCMFFKGMACWHLGMWRVDHGPGRSFLLAETSHSSYTENVHCSEGLFVFPLLWCTSWRSSAAAICPLVVNSVEESWTLQVPVWVVILHALSTPSPFFSLLFLTPFPMLLLSPIKDVIKLSFLGQCKCEALLAICIKPHKPHQCTPALWSLSSESLGWGQSHFTSSNSVSECQIELKLEASPLKRKAQSLCSELQSKTQPHTQTTIPHWCFSRMVLANKRGTFTS